MLSALGWRPRNSDHQVKSEKQLEAEQAKLAKQVSDNGRIASQVGDFAMKHNMLWFMQGEPQPVIKWGYNFCK